MLKTAETFRILGDETRLRILRLLREQPLNVGELTSILGLAQPTVSKHLGELRKAGLVEDNRSSSYSYYRLDEKRDGWWKILSPELTKNADGKGDLVRLQEVLRQREVRSEVPDRFVVPGRSWSAWSRSLRFLLPALRVADFGCGDATFTLEMASWAQRVYAVDSNPTFLKMAKARAHGVKNIRFRRENMERVSLRSGSVDLVVISQSLHYVEKPLRVLREAFRILGSKGRVLLLDLLPHQEEWVVSQLRHRWLGFDPKLVRGWLKEAGFRNLQTESMTKNTTEPFRILLATATKP